MIRTVAMGLGLGLLSFAVSVLAQQPVAGPTWDRAAAVEAASTVDTNSALRPLFELARSGSDAELIRELDDLARRSAWPLPAREHILHAFAVGLGDLEPGAVGPRVLAYLQTYVPRTLVAHDDHPKAGVPLFNVAAAAAGTEALWQRLQSASEAAALLQDETVWLQAYAAAGPARRRGFEDALQHASEARIAAIGRLALAATGANPDLAHLAARTGVLLTDEELFLGALSAARGPGVSHALRAAAAVFDDSAIGTILRRALERAPASSAALAIAILGPGQLRYADMAELMFGVLDDHELGAAAALLLATSDDGAIRQRLDQLARHKEGTAARRAAVAIRAAGRHERGLQ
jgi:hypothetical protein